jgi:hypothetical protein
MTANRGIQITALAVGAVWPVLAGPAAAYASERRWHAAVETGPALQTCNDFRIYADAGTFAFFHCAAAGVRVRF